MAAAIAYGFWVGRERPSAYFGLMLFLTSAVVGVFASQDLLLFYVFFEAMMIPLYVLIGVWGGAGTPRRDRQVRDLHDGGLAADAGRGDRLRAPAGLVRPDLDDDEQQHVALPRLCRSRSRSRRRCSRSTAGCRTRTVSRRPRWPRCLSGVISKAAVFGFIRICFAKFPGPFDDWRNVVLALAAVGLVYGSLLAFRAPGRSRRDRVFEPRADGADHDRRVRQQHDRRSAARSSRPSTTG